MDGIERQSDGALQLTTRGAGFVNVTQEVEEWLSDQAATQGLLTLFLQHTSASLVIQENADPDVLGDLQRFFSKLVPENAGYVHDAEGPDDMPAHIRTALTQTHLFEIFLMNSKFRPQQ